MFLRTNESWLRGSYERLKRFVFALHNVACKLKETLEEMATMMNATNDRITELEKKMENIESIIQIDVNGNVVITEGSHMQIGFVRIPMDPRLLFQYNHEALDLEKGNIYIEEGSGFLKFSGHAHYFSTKKNEGFKLSQMTTT
jgi:hypothetical protein